MQNALKQLRGLSSVGIVCLVVSAASAFAQDTGRARSVLEEAAAAMGGLQRLRALDNFVMTGFGQRYQANGAISANPKSPPKWIAVADAERTFDLRGKRALNLERNSQMFPFALRSGHSWNRGVTLQTGVAMLDHPLPALLEALDPGARLGAVSVEDGRSVVAFTTRDGVNLWIAIDPRTHFPYWTRWISSSDTLGDVTNTAYFTGYLPFDGVWLPSGIMTEIDWRHQVTLMFQVDSYRLDVDVLPDFPAPRPRGAQREPEVVVNRVADGVWDLDVARGNPLAELGDSGGALIEFADHLVLFEPYGSEAQTLARIDKADELVPGKKVTAMIVTHHHADHAAGLRAAVSRGLTIIAQRANGPLFEEWVSRPAVVYPDELARHPLPLKFMPVDEHLVLEDSMRRLDVYHAVGDMHMSDALIAYLPEEKIIMEGDFSDEHYMFNWWADAFHANMERYGIDPQIDIPVHGSVGPVAEKLVRIEEQVEAAQAFCAETAQRGAYVLGCPVQYSTTGPIER